MNILVTGATGFIGQNLIPILLGGGHHITVLARKKEKASNFHWYKKVRFITYNILDISKPLPPIGEHDAIIHLAWTGLPNYKSLFHFETNLPANYRFLKDIIGRGVNHVLVSGTCFEYGMQSGCLSEEIQTQPSNPYALAKDTLRKFLESLEKEKSFNLQWARLFYMYGPGQSHLSLLSQLDEAIERKDKIFNMSGGEQLRDYLSVQEVARKLAVLAEHPKCNGIVNICSGKPISVRRLVEQQLSIKNKKIRLNLGYYPYSDYEPMAFWGNNSKYNTMCKE
jgi:nucleoside-diphosphate-sugar epimerase